VCEPHFGLLTGTMGLCPPSSRFVICEWTCDPVSVHEAHRLRVCMAGLRRKVEIDAAQPVYLRTETGLGYRIIDE
jgi:DNA-binding response OmpR family regulator